MVAGLILHYIAKYIFINRSQWPLHYVNASKQQNNRVMMHDFSNSTTSNMFTVLYMTSMQAEKAMRVHTDLILALRG